MEIVDPKVALKEIILKLQIKSDLEFLELKDQFHLTCESLKPLNLLKSTVKELINSNGSKSGMGSTFIGLASGFLIKNIFFRSTRNPLKYIAGIALETLAANLASNNSGQIKHAAKSIFKAITSKRSPKKGTFSEEEIYR